MDYYIFLKENVNINVKFIISNVVTNFFSNVVKSMKIVLKFMFIYNFFLHVPNKKNHSQCRS